jgi:spermidine synthase
MTNPNSGLGIGTTPSAFIAHGINTTVVEIDPTVYYFARKYFALPKNHTAVVQDATTFVQYDTGKYDYIIHDVFTGGAEPAELFTVEFIQSLHDLLTPKGVIAVVWSNSNFDYTF